MNVVNGYCQSTRNAINDYYQDTLSYVGTSAERFKKLRDDVDFFQKISILQKGLINFINQARGTNLMGKLANVLDKAYITDAFGFIGDVNGWLKPINANTVYASALLEKILDAYVLNIEDSETREETKNSLRKFISPVLEKLILDLNDTSQGQKLGYATSAQFMTAVQQRLREAALLETILDAYGVVLDPSEAAQGGEVDSQEANLELPQALTIEDKQRLKADLKEKITPILSKLIQKLLAENLGRLINYRDNDAILAPLQESIIAAYRVVNNDTEIARLTTAFRALEHYDFHDIDLVKEIPEVPLYEVNWGDWLTKRSFEAVGFICVVDYLGEWGFIDKAKWAASIGISNFGLGFNILIGTAFTLGAIQLTRKLYAAYYNDPEVGPNAKLKLPAQRMTMVAEAFFYGKSILNEVKGNASSIIDSLSLIAAKSIGSYSIASGPSFNVYDTPAPVPVSVLVEVEEPSLVSRSVARIKTAVSFLFSPITHNRYVLKVTEKVMNAVTVIFEGLNDFVNYEKDGYDKMYKIVIPGLELGARTLAYFELASGNVTDKCIDTLKGHRFLLYATKWMGCVAGWKDKNKGIPNWIIQNPATGNYEMRGPLYKWDHTAQRFESQWLSPSAWSKVLLDVANFVEPARFMRKYEIYQFDYFVKIGNQLAEKTISLFGHTVLVKDVPFVREIFSTPKNLPVAMAAGIDVGVQLWSGVVKRDKTQFEFKNLCQFGANVGKIAIIGVGYADSAWFEILCLATGLSGGVKHWLTNYENRGRFKLIGTPVAAEAA